MKDIVAKRKADFLKQHPGSMSENIRDMTSREFDMSKPTKICGDVLYFDFGSATDGPAYYTDKDGKILCHAGGQCRMQKYNCGECIRNLNLKCDK